MNDGRQAYFLSALSNQHNESLDLFLPWERAAWWHAGYLRPVHQGAKVCFIFHNDSLFSDTLRMAMLVAPAAILVQPEIIQQQSDRFQWHFELTFKVPRGELPMTLVIPWLYIQYHQHPQITPNPTSNATVRWTFLAFSEMSWQLLYGFKCVQYKFLDQIPTKLTISFSCTDVH